MFQSFEETADPTQGPARLALLRQEIPKAKVDGFLVPRADVHQGEYVAARDARLAWLTGFTGSAGFCAVLADKAGVFIDGRYRTQVKEQVDLSAFQPVPWPEVKLGTWLAQEADGAAVIGFDPWLHSVEEIEKLRTLVEQSPVTLRESDNLVDRIWHDQPAAPCGKIFAFPAALAGENHTSKRDRLAEGLRRKGVAATVLSLPDSIAWMLNIRGRDIERNPVPHCLAVLHEDATVALFATAEKVDAEMRAHLGSAVRLYEPEQFEDYLSALSGVVQLDRASCPMQVANILRAAQVEIAWAQDPCVLPKACKTAAEIAGTVEAHLTDAAAMCEFLSWYDQQPVGSLSEIDMVTELEAQRRATNQLRDISFDTISGSGANGAVIHYRVTEKTNAPLREGELIVLDSGGQYLNGTTDITRTLPIGHVGDDEKACFTRVLQGMIGVSRLRFPQGLAGRDIDAIARAPLWAAGQDYDHGTGHGVGVFLCVHEGPQRISRVSDVALRPGMILSNEPGYYREGAFGIRIENLIVVQEAAALDGADARAMYDFKTLTWVPIDRRLIKTEMLSRTERDWLNAYHAQCRDKISPRLGPQAQLWLAQATAPL